MPGQFGPYYLKELINSGGMADIWLATDRELQACALRRLHDDLRSDRTSRKRFLAGCEVLSRIHNHDCVIGLLRAVTARLKRAKHLGHGIRRGRELEA